MLKNKERRDTILLGFMGLITLVFLLYIFIPGSGSTKKKTKKNPEPIGSSSSNSQLQNPVKQKLPDDPTEASILLELDQQLQQELETIYKTSIPSPKPFSSYATNKLENLPRQLKSDLVAKLFKFSFRDLRDIANLEFPANYSSSLKFNLYLALFLIKLKGDNVEQTFIDLPWSTFEELVDFRCYELINNELSADYQMLPVLFYFKQLAARLNLYPWFDYTSFFKAKLGPLRDLTGSKYLEKIRSLLEFSLQMERYRLRWVEHDGIGADDKKEYGNMNLKTIHFLNQEYLVFPDDANDTNNQWLRDLHGADAGNIELKYLYIHNEDPARNTRIRKIIYSPLNSKFILLMKTYDPQHSQEFTDRILAKCLKEYHKSYTIIDFTDKELDKVTLKKALKEFGHYIKRNPAAISIK
jgi:hypothetical protein